MPGGKLFSSDNDLIMTKSVIDLATGMHSVACNLCRTIIKLGTTGAEVCTMEYRRNHQCERITLREAKEAAKSDIW